MNKEKSRQWAAFYKVHEVPGMDCLFGGLLELLG